MEFLKRVWKAIDDDMALLLCSGVIIGSAASAQFWWLSALMYIQGIVGAVWAWRRLRDRRVVHVQTADTEGGSHD